MPQDSVELLVDESLFEGANYQVILGNSSFYYVRKTEFYRRKFRILEAALRKNYTLQIYIICSHLLKTVIANARFIVRRLSFTSKNIETIFPANNNLNYDYIFITHAFGESEAEDPYFGKVPYLVSREKKVLVASIDHSSTWFSGFYWSRVNVIDDSLSKIVIPAAAPIKYLVKRHLQKLKNILKFKFWPTLWGGRIFGSLNLFGPDAIFDDCFQFYFTQCLEQSRENVVVVITYEGYGWERRACDLLHAKKAHGKIVGYHHVHYRPDLVSVNYNLGQDSQPDLILVTNEKTCKEFSTHQSVLIENVGSIKVSNYANTIGLTENNRSQCTVLLIPEGLDSEEKYFLDFIRKFAKGLDHIKFVYRPHPSRRDLLPRIKAHLSLLGLKNVSISTGNIQDDIVRSNLIIYRGSMAIFEALKYNVRVGFLDCDEEMIDVLDGISTRKVSILDSLETMNSFLLSCMDDSSIDLFKERSLKIRKVCEPLNHLLFLDLLKSIRSKEI